MWYNEEKNWEFLMKFSSAYNPGEFEADIYAAWETAGKFLPAAEGSKKFSIVMPPPNANGNLHIGHGLTVALEDSLTRYYRLRGQRTWYIPGADHAGFETWVVYERTLEKEGHTRFEYSRDELYARVWDFVQMQRGNMELQLRALGASCSWKDLTFTLDENVVRRVYTTFERMWKDGMVYRGEKLVNYCTKHQTAFADIEVEHEEEDGKLWDIAYPYDGGEIIVSTTRPETLFGDTAVAVNPADTRYSEIVGKNVMLPLTDREISVITDEHADPEYGTGAVKITPAHDNDDFEVGLRHDLPRISVIEPDGTMSPVCGAYAGMTTAECRKQVLKDLKELGLLRGERKIRHTVAHCYKCGTVIEPMLKEQWFVDTEKLAAEAIKHLEAGEIKFFPASREKVLINYLKGLKDWNISRQIPWGIAIPMFRRADLAYGNASEQKAIFTPGASADANTPTPSQFAGAAPEWVFDTRVNLSEIEIGGVKYVRDEDTFDTWFSSAHWPIVCTNWEEGVGSPFYPLDVMETGADILFAWVSRMIMMGVYVTGQVPFEKVYLHGLVLDEHGKKMSKSKGNVINPMDMIAKYGSDAFRLGILRGRSAGMAQAFSEQSVVSGQKLCNKLWNISRFIQGIVDEEVSEKGYSSTALDTLVRTVDNDDQDDRTDMLGAIHKSESDSINPDQYEYTTNNMGEDWICREIDRTRKMVEQDIAEYRFAEAVEDIYSLIWDKYADWFVESQKLYKNVPLLRATLESILTMFHPFAPFVTEAIWQNLSWTDGFLIDAKWPSTLEYDEISAENFARLTEVVSEIRATNTALALLSKGKKYDVLYGDDSLVAGCPDLVKILSHVPSIASTEGSPRGLRLALANHEIYLDVPGDVVQKYREELEKKILSVGAELDSLNARMMNPRYVEKAPAGLVKETRDRIDEKTKLIERLKLQLEVI
ncbi:MAG: valine--tRNA ligase [Candidatus Saccharibacteria bacterium]|nr:valine--tRNA ligase [Candidatus Saccharibacteria bacterium]